MAATYYPFPRAPARWSPPMPLPVCWPLPFGGAYTVAPPHPTAVRSASHALAQPAGSASGGASPYPMLPWMGALHGTLGAEIADFLQGNESAEQTLADVEAAYTAAAKEKGFL